MLCGSSDIIAVVLVLRLVTDRFGVATDCGDSDVEEVLSFNMLRRAAVDASLCKLEFKKTIQLC